MLNVIFPNSLANYTLIPETLTHIDCILTKYKMMLAEGNAMQ